jgi:hypothetical protein
MASIIAPLYQVFQCVADAPRRDFYIGWALLVRAPLPEGYLLEAQPLSRLFRVEMRSHLSVLYTPQCDLSKYF